MQSFKVLQDRQNKQTRTFRSPGERQHAVPGRKKNKKKHTQ